MEKERSNSVFSILIDVLRINKIKVWSIDISNTIRRIIAEIREKGSLDFDMFGVALLSAAVIYRKKTEELLKLEEPPKTKENQDTVNYNYEEIIGRLMSTISEIPIRVKHPPPDSTEIFSILIDILNRVLKERNQEALVLEEPTEIEIVRDEFLESINERIEMLKKEIEEKLKFNYRIKLVEVIYNDDWIEVIRNFISLLFILTTSDLEIVYEGEEMWLVRSQESIKIN